MKGNTMLEIGKSYRFFAKQHDSKRFKPMDMSQGGIVDDLTKATVFEVDDDETKARLEDMIDKYRTNYWFDAFEFREVKD